MRLATFNIKRGLRSDGVVDNGALVDACVSLRADVLALQEVDCDVPRSAHLNQAEAIARACGLAHVFAPALRARAGGFYGNALLARGNIADVEVLRLPVASHRQGRNCVLARIAIGDTSLSVAATHLQNRRGGAPRVPEEAGEQLEQLRVVLDALGARPAPRVLLGDLNSFPAVIEPLLGGKGLSVASREPTAPAHRPVGQIDYVAVQGLRVVSSETIATAVSDHLAVVAEALPEAGTISDRTDRDTLS